MSSAEAHNSNVMVLTYETEFAPFLAVLEILSCSWAETAHTRHFE